MDIVSLFAGCGGLDCGFERAGFKIVWANEFDEAIHDTYRLNHPDTILDTHDIRSLTGSDIPACDGIIGGPPCQPWSEGGKRLGIEDPRGQLLFDYIRIVKDKNPNFFVIENVPGILEEKHRESLTFFLKLLKDTGYNITYELLNAANYRIPQDRIRVFFIGIRNDLKNTYNFPDAVSPVPITLRQAIGDITEEPRFFCNERISTDHPYRMNHDVYSGPYDARYMARNRVRSWGEPSFAMQAQARNAPQHPQAPKMTYISSSLRTFAAGYECLYRRLSVRECARIQTFPDNFRFIYSDIKDGYKMVGNAVPPRLAWHIAIQMKKAFAEEEDYKMKVRQKTDKQIHVNSIAAQYPEAIVKNKPVIIRDDIDLRKNVLIALVKSDSIAHFANQTACIYYTGNKFPSTIALNKLYYFMPYIKGKGIRDLYYIKIARIGTKQEMHPGSNDNSLRLVFEIEYIKKLFSDYMPVHLNIWRSFTDTVMSKLVAYDPDLSLDIGY